MRKFAKSPRPPESYEKFVAENPAAKWNYLSENKDLQTIKNNLKEALYADQLGLCAYCESKLHLANGAAVDDFRVEHFHPKGDKNSAVNWHLPWTNLLAVCTGGNQNSLADSSKFTRPDFSCDVPKGERILDDIILNPCCDLGEGDRIFYFRSDGKMVIHENCPTTLRARALACIKELRLSDFDGASPPAKRLDILRRDVIARVSETIIEETQQLTLSNPQLDDDEIFFIALSSVAEKIIPDPNDPPSFYSAVSQFLGR